METIAPSLASEKVVAVDADDHRLFGNYKRDHQNK